ncbi:MAG: nucleotidyltransferase domain-containing protein [Clostridia bacterium]|nr:nucleotidyltransferase domain-containing protein [Clostridia bacterium]
MNFGLTMETYEKILNLIEKYPDLEFKVFGSRARGDYKDGSDIDIAIFGEACEDTKFHVLNEFDLLDIPYQVDVVFVKDIRKPEFLESIERDGVKFK